MPALAGMPWNDNPRETVTTALGSDLEPMTNLQGSAKMKLHLQRVLTGRAIDMALANVKDS